MTGVFPALYETHHFVIVVARRCFASRLARTGIPSCTITLITGWPNSEYKPLRPRTEIKKSTPYLSRSVFVNLNLSTVFCEVVFYSSYRFIYLFFSLFFEYGASLA